MRTAAARCSLLPLPLLLSALAPLRGDEAPAPTPADMARAYAAGDYAAVETLARRSLAIDPHDGTASYDLSCALAHQGHAADALAALAAAQAHGFEDADHAAQDSDLASLHGMPRFDAIVAAMRAAPYAPQAPQEADWPIPGLVSVEQDPPGGMAYRVRLPATASARHPLRLVVWLHPSGGSMNKDVEPLATDLAAHGYALLVFTRKQWMGWSDGEVGRILPSIASLRPDHRVDGRQPVLMGFSAGGQVALTLCAAHPTAWSGMLLDAAYPIDAATHRLATPTPAEQQAQVPIEVLVGAQDPHRGLWDAARSSWQTLPLEIVTVPDRGHAFLYAGQAWQSCLHWLDTHRPSTSRR